MVTKLGMSSLGNLSFQENDYTYKEFSDQTNKKIDEECSKIISNLNQKATQMVQQHKELILTLSELLLEKKTIDINDITSVLGLRDTKELKEYIKNKNLEN